MTEQEVEIIANVDVLIQKLTCRHAIERELSIFSFIESYIVCMSCNVHIASPRQSTGLREILYKNKPVEQRDSFKNWLKNTTSFTEEFLKIQTAETSAHSFRLTRSQAPFKISLQHHYDFNYKLTGRDREYQVIIDEVGASLCSSVVQEDPVPDTEEEEEEEEEEDDEMVSRSLSQNNNEVEDQSEPSSDNDTPLFRVTLILLVIINFS